MPKKNLKDNISNVPTQKSRMVSLVVTRDCNLRCNYCYEKHDLRDKKIMDFSIAAAAISRYVAEKGYDLLEIDFFGGEPMLSFHLIKDVVEWFHSQKWEINHRFLIGTNGTILTEEMKEWLIKNRNCVNIALSMDGNKIAHNICRSNSYDLVYQNLPFFKEYWPHQPIKMTISGETIQYVSDSIIEMEEMELLFTSNVAFENIWGDDDEKAALLDIYEDQLSRLVDYYASRPELFPVSPLLTAVPEYLGIPGYQNKDTDEVKRFCGAGHEMVVIDVDGTEYPCHRFLPWVTGRPAPKEGANCQTAWKPEKCSNCKLLPSCPTCAGLNWEINGDSGIRTTFHCNSYKLEVLASCQLEIKRLKHKMKRLANLSTSEKKQMKMQVEAILDLIENGF
jgi:uncharacterized protein